MNHSPRRLASLVFAALLWFGVDALAEEPVLVPPRLVHDDGVKYPEQALRDRVLETVVVTLTLTVDANGDVSVVDVDTPTGHGFAEAATETARHLKFEPATRSGAPVAARIRFRYTFAPPPPWLAGTVTTSVGRAIAGAMIAARAADGPTRTAVSGADGAWAIEGLPPGRVRVEATAAGFEPFAADAVLLPAELTNVVLRLAPRVKAQDAGAADADVDKTPTEEVTVKGQPPAREVTRRTMTADEIAHLPGARGDALASLQAMPGVGHAPAFSGQIIVRGSAPNDTNVYVDGTRVPIVYHFGGLSSVVPTELLEKLDFVPGNYSAEYGRGMGGIVDVGIRNPKKDDRFHGMAQVDLIDARLRQVDLSVDAFYKDLDRLVVPGAGNAGKGRAFGLEWLLRYTPDEHFFGWIAYTLSRSERRDRPSLPWYAFQYDQTHNLSVVASYRFNERWRVGGRFRFTTGDPYTPNSYGAYDANGAAYAPTLGYPPFGSTLPPFHELDLRVDRTFRIGAIMLTLSADIANVYSYRAPTGASYNYSYAQRGYDQGLPILPSLGIRGEL